MVTDHGYRDPVARVSLALRQAYPAAERDALDGAARAAIDALGGPEHVGACLGLGHVYATCNVVTACQAPDKERTIRVYVEGDMGAVGIGDTLAEAVADYDRQHYAPGA